tara:strand:+ start:249 stop:443 length:195 start_codon:yes stop_codon:yes gene_type:complete
VVDAIKAIKYPLGCRFCGTGVAIACFKGESEALTEIDPAKHTLGAGLYCSCPVGGFHQAGTGSA